MCTLSILIFQVCVLYIPPRHAREKVLISTKLQLLSIVRKYHLVCLSLQCFSVENLNLFLSYRSRVMAASNCTWKVSSVLLFALGFNTVINKSLYSKTVYKS